MVREVTCRGCGQQHDPMKNCPAPKPPNPALIKYLLEQDQRRRKYMRDYMRDYRDKQKAKAAKGAKP